MNTIDSNELQKIRCPRCNKKMSHGYIAGHWFRLRWTKTEKTKTTFAGKALRKKIDLWNSPTLEAVRCEDCKIGIFRYDY